MKDRKDYIGEVWKPSEGFEDRYEVSNLGRVRGLDKRVRCAHGKRNMRGRTLSLIVNTCGYLRVAIGRDRKFKTVVVHRLIAMAFVPNHRGVRYVNHKNGIKTDNRSENLEWVTKHEDVLHAHNTGLNHSRFSAKQKEAARRNLDLTYSHRKHYANAKAT
jgi:NUMOD4 motif/HNH endonuclease